jgi:cytochrome P450
MSESNDGRAIPDLDWRSEDYLRDPKGQLTELARDHTLARTEAGFAVLRKDEARTILREEVPMSTRHISEEISPYLAERSKEPLLMRAGPDHIRLRGMLGKVMRSRVIEDLRPRIREIFNTLLDDVVAKREADLVRDLFDPFPARVLAPMLGLPLEDVPMVANWVSVSARWTNNLLREDELLEVEAAFRDLENYLLGLLRERRTNLRDDLLSELIREMKGADEMQVVGIAAELNRAGMDTTRRQLANTMYALLQHPKEWKRLTENPEIAATVVEEGMRYAPIIHVLMRQTVQDGEHLGVEAPKGTLFTPMPMAINFDPTATPNPEAFDVERNPCPHFTFGSGSHSCIGAPLARMEMTEAFKILGQRIERFELLPGEIPRSSVSDGSVPTRLPVKVVPRNA